MRKTIRAAISLIFMASSTAAATPYDVFPVGPIRTGGGFHIALDINELGFVSGVTNESDGSSDAYVWDSNTQTFLNLGPLPSGVTRRGINASPVKINDGNAITGNMTGPGIQEAYIISGGVTQGLGFLPGDGVSVGIDINNLGHAVGLSFDSNSVESPFFWNGTAISPLGLIPGASRGIVSGINNSDQAVGWNSDFPQSFSKAVIWTGGVPTAIPIPNDTLLNSAAGAISDSGVVTGWYILEFPESNGADRKFFKWDGSSLVESQAVRGGTVIDINSSGRVVGSLPGSGLPGSAMLWDDILGILDLNDQIGPASGWELIAAYGINDSGWIVGRGFNPLGVAQGFLLVPTGEPLIAPPDQPTNGIPEPTTLALFGFALAGLGYARRRRTAQATIQR